MPVFVQVDVRSLVVGRRRVRGLAQAVLTFLGEPSADLSLLFVGDRRMRRLNHRFRHKDRSTDVLAFACREGRAPHGFNRGTAPLGDVVIALPTAERQARAANHSLEEEIVTLLIHGVLHLCGYDHERGASEALRMQRKERQMRRRLGLIPPFVRSRHKAAQQDRKGS
jgi:probable rRNA maturation factor